MMMMMMMMGMQWRKLKSDYFHCSVGLQFQWQVSVHSINTDVKSWTGSQLSYLLQVCWIACWNLNLKLCSSSQGVRSCSLKLLSTTQPAWMCEVLLNIELKFQYLAIACYHAVFIERSVVQTWDRQLDSDVHPFQVGKMITSFGCE